MLGHRVVDVAGERGWDVTGIDVAEADITDASATEALIGELKPDAVIHCAAYTNVDAAEENEDAALAINGDGAGNVAVAAAKAGARIVQVSTDYVFDGENDKPWVESDAPGPHGAYGRTKLAGEHAVAAGNPDHAIARTAWLFGAGGPNFCDTMLRLAAERESVSVVTDQQGCPTWTGHLAPALLDLAAARETGLFHTAGAGSCSWFSLTQELFERAGADCEVVPTTAAEFASAAPRPAWSVMASERPETPRLPDWQQGVAGHLSETIGR
jgi:dTDP-4-dehydrorhamnose reductase